MTKHKKSLPSVSRNISAERINTLNSELCNIDWSPVYITEDVNEAYDTFLSMFIPLLDKHLLFKNAKVPNNKIRKPWITPKLLRNIKRKNKLYKTFLNEKTPLSETRYKRYRNKVTNLLRHAKKTYYCNELDQSKNDTKHTWSVINKILHKSEKEMPNYFTCNDKKEDNPQNIANEFNSYFDNCCSAALESMPPIKIHVTLLLKVTFLILVNNKFFFILFENLT